MMGRILPWLLGSKPTLGVGEGRCSEGGFDGMRGRLSVEAETKDCKAQTLKLASHSKL